MHRIEGANCTIDNLFTDGHPGTTITAAFLNAVQEELCGIIDRSGIQLNSQGTDTRDQLYTALARLFYSTSGGLKFPTWISGVDYTSGTVVIHNGTIYLCLITHTAGVFETDRVTSGCWSATCPFPVGSIIPQFPSASSNTINTAFPVSERPVAVYGGTWQQIYHTEAIFWKTEGDFGVAELQDTNRTNGKQTHQMQGHFHNPFTSYTNFVEYQAGIAALATTGGGNGWNNVSTTGSPSNDGVSGVPAVGYETRPQNRIMMLWQRTA